MNIEQFCDMWWGQWQNFSEELYAFVEDGLATLSLSLLVLFNHLCTLLTCIVVHYVRVHSSPG
jgi:hypothetical protein